MSTTGGLHEHEERLRMSMVASTGTDRDCNRNAIVACLPAKGARMSDHLIAIVGSLFPGRQYDPPALDVPGGRAAARAIGKELARRGCRLAVYDHTSIEGDVVAGFLSATPPPKEQSIEIHYSVDTPQRADFPERKTGQENFFVEKPDTSKEWEVSYYRTLGKVDGLVLVGGGPSTLVTGLIG